MKFVIFCFFLKELWVGWFEGDKVIDMNFVSEGKIFFFMIVFLEKVDEYVEVVWNIKNLNKGIYVLEEV